MHLHPKLLPEKLPHIPLFRIFYSTTFTVLTLLLLAALLITPGDHILQSFRAGQVYHIFIISGFYLLTLIVSVLIYGGRLYATRSALAGIPREWSGAEGKGVGVRLGKVGRVVQRGVERSAWVAYESTPRDLKGDGRDGRGAAERLGVGLGLVQRRSGESDHSVKPAWGMISHPGWSSSSSTDLPNLHYEPVILELPHLIEAKAASLAPPDPLYEPPSDGEAEEPPLPDPLVISLLQRPASMGLRDYIAHLTTLNMITPASLGAEFLTIYEQARFSGEELNELEFRGLMSVFAEILRNMTPLSPSIVEELHAEADYESSSEGPVAAEDGADGRSVMTNETVEHTPNPDVWSSARPDVWTSSSSSFSSSSASTSNKSSNDDGTVHTAPSRPGGVLARDDSRATRASARRGVHTPSIASLRMVRRTSGSTWSGGSSSAAGSVIRLAEARTELDLPFEFIGGER